MGDAILGLALAGALAAFLRVNLPPARVYLGDAGSMTLGLMVSALSVRACSDGSSNAVSLPPLLALLTLPLLDVVTAIGRRSIMGRSVYTPDRGHIHHCLRSRLGSTVAALSAAVGLATLGAGAAALVKVDGSRDLASCLAIVISVGLLVGTNTFGRSESRLLLFRIRTALTPLLTGGAVRRGGIQRGCQLHGIRDWAGVWDALIREVEDGGVWRIELAIDMAAAGEVYHGLWSSAGGVGRRSELVGRPQPLRRGCPGGSPARGGQHRRVSVPPSRQGGGTRPDAGGPARIGRPSPSLSVVPCRLLPMSAWRARRMLEDQLGSILPRALRGPHVRSAGVAYVVSCRLSVRMNPGMTGMKQSYHDLLVWQKALSGLVSSLTTDHRPGPPATHKLPYLEPF